jgi:S1-C subfamily serine protease
MWLTITDGEGKGLSVRVEGERVLVGSGPENRLIIHDDTVDPIHALFEINSDGDVEVQDLRTKAGTFVNGERIGGMTHVPDGAEIKIGGTTLTATLDDPAENEDVGEPAVEVNVPPEPPSPDADEDAVALVTAPEGTHVEVVPEGRRRRLRERVRLATGLAIGAAALAVIAVIAVLALSGGDDEASTEEIVRDVTPSTVLVRVSGTTGEGAGSGFVLDAEEGLIVTNFHVVNGADGITVVGQDSVGSGEIVGAAPCDDLAVVKIDDPDGLKTLKLGSQKSLKQGEGVVAIGYPANASNEDKLTSTAGVVSVVESTFRFDSPDSPQYANVVQTDAALNPGNSGGPLVDKRKQLVGVNTAILTSAQGAPIGGQGYAIGVDRVKEVVEVLRKGQSQGWAGFGFLFATDSQAKKEDLPTEGIIVSPAAPGTPAEKADIGPEGALLLAVNGQQLDGTLTDYCSKVGDLETGRSVPVTLLDKPGAKPRTVALSFSG